MSRAVIDQPGLRVFFIGLVLSLFMGLALRSQISSAQLRPHLDKAISRLDKDLKIDFKDAHIQLSNWGLPLPYIQIDDIRLSPRKLHCHESQVFINQIQLPIRLWALFTGTDIIEKIRISEAEIRIGKIEKCFESSEESELSSLNEINKKLNISKTQQTPSNQQTFFQRRSAGSLRQIHIDRLRLILTRYPTQPITIKNMHFDINYEAKKLKDIILTSQIYALKDSTSDVLFLKADLNALIKSNQVGEVDSILNIKGQILDGAVNIFTTYSGVNKTVHSEVQLKRISTKVVANLPFFSDAGVYQLLSNLPLNMNLEASGMHRLDTDEFDYKIKELNFISGESLVQASDIMISKKNRLTKINEFLADIKNFNLEQLRLLPSLQEVAKSIDNFGAFTGQLQFRSQNLEQELKPQLELTGNLKNMAFIFSNRGVRDLQYVDSMQVKFNKNNLESHLEIEEVYANGNTLQGKIVSDFQAKDSEAVARAELKGVLLGPTIWKQLTGTEQAPEVILKWNYKNNFQEKHDLAISIPLVKISGIELKDLRLELIQNLKDKKIESLSMTGSSKSAAIVTGQLTDDFFKTIFSLQNNLSAEQYTSENLQLNLNGPNWKNLDFTFETNLRINSAKNRSHRLLIQGKTAEDESVQGILVVNDYINNSKVQNRFSKTGTKPIVLIK